MEGERVQKIVSRSGICSRRQAEELILDGKIKVNGQTITQLGTRVDSLNDRIEVDGKPIQVKEPIYIILNKPKGYVTTLSDPHHSKTIVDLIKDIGKRIFPCGRLDKETEGLLILTNDGEFFHLLTHPRFRVPKTYIAKLQGSANEEEIDRLKKGIRLKEGFVQPGEVRVLERKKNFTMIEITVYEGRKHEIRRMGAAIGHPVLELTRIKHGIWELGNLPSGEYRYIDLEEVKHFKERFQGK